MRDWSESAVIGTVAAGEEAMKGWEVEGVEFFDKIVVLLHLGTAPAQTHESQRYRGRRTAEMKEDG
jgi:hypothetical protein